VGLSTSLDDVERRKWESRKGRELSRLPWFDRMNEKCSPPRACAMTTFRCLACSVPITIPSALAICFAVYATSLFAFLIKHSDLSLCVSVFIQALVLISCLFRPRSSVGT
jgi:hypothetical protein